MSELSQIVTRSYRRFTHSLVRNLAGITVPNQPAASVAAMADTFPAGDVLVSVELIAYRPDTWPQFADWTARQVVGKPQPIYPAMGPLDLRMAGTREQIDEAVARMRERTSQVLVSRPMKLDAPAPDGSPRYSITVTVVEW